MNVTHTAITKKVDADIKIFIFFLEQAKGVIIKSANRTITTIKNIKKFIQDCFKVVKVTVDILIWIQNVVQDSWNPYWRDRVLAILTGEPIFSVPKSKEIVRQLKIDYPTETNRQIANRLIAEKSIFATLAGLIPDIPIVQGLVTVSLFNTFDLMNEMIYKIAYSYGDDTIDDGDKLAI